MITAEQTRAKIAGIESKLVSHKKGRDNAKEQGCDLLIGTHTDIISMLLAQRAVLNELLNEAKG